MLSASRRQPHLLHVSAVDRRQIWSVDKSWRCVTLSGFLRSHTVRCRRNPISCGTHYSGPGTADLTFSYSLFGLISRCRRYLDGEFARVRKSTAGQCVAFVCDSVIWSWVNDSEFVVVDKLSCCRRRRCFVSFFVVICSSADTARFPPVCLVAVKCSSTHVFVITLRASCGAVFCNWSCLWVCLFVGLLPR